MVKVVLDPSLKLWYVLGGTYIGVAPILELYSTTQIYCYLEIEYTKKYIIDLHHSACFVFFFIYSFLETPVLLLIIYPVAVWLWLVTESSQYAKCL